MSDERWGEEDRAVGPEDFAASSGPSGWQSSALHDDDELADALSEEVSRLTGAIPIIWHVEMPELDETGASEFFGRQSSERDSSTPAFSAPEPLVAATFADTGSGGGAATPPEPEREPEPEPATQHPGPEPVTAHEVASAAEPERELLRLPPDYSLLDAPPAPSGGAPFTDFLLSETPSQAPESSPSAPFDGGAAYFDSELRDDSTPAASPEEIPPVEWSVPDQAVPLLGAGSFSLLDAPPPRPETVVVPPPGSQFPAMPQRRSLDDDALQAEIARGIATAGGTAAAMSSLEYQLQLREQENQEFHSWERSMLAIGTPEAREAVDQGRLAFTGMIPIQADRASEEVPLEQPVTGLPSSAEPAETSSGEPDADTVEEPVGAVEESVEPPELIPPPPPAPATPSPLHLSGAFLRVDPTLLETPGFVLDDAVDDDDEIDIEDRASSEIIDADVGAVPAFVATGESAAPQPSPRELPTENPHRSQMSASEISEVPPQYAPTPSNPPVLTIEENDGAPTPLEERAGRATRMFWMWFAANSSVLSVAIGAGLFGLGMSLRQTFVAILAGVALSFVPLALGTLAGKWSGQPTMIVSRAAFGLRGNAVPAGIALLTRVFWGAVLLWVFAIGSAHVIDYSGVGGDFGEQRFAIIALALGFFLAIVVAFFGFALLARVFLVASIASAVLVVGLIALTWQRVNLAVAVSTPDGSWMLVVSGAVVVFSYVGLAWANSSSDLARYQRVGGSGASSMAWGTLGMTAPIIVLMSYGALLAASNSRYANGLVDHPLETLASMLPAWYPAVLVSVLGISLLCGVVLAIYSGAFALQSLGVRMRRPFAVMIVAVALGLIAVVLTFAELGSIEGIRDVAITLAVPVAAWAGVFAADMMIRTRRFDGASLLRRGGLYRDFNWLNLGTLLLACIVGFGLTTATTAALGWQGYLFSLAGLPADGVVASSDLGVIVALIIGLLGPVLTGVPAIRRQERLRP